MLPKNLKILRYAGLLFSVVALCSVLVYPSLKGESAPPDVGDLQKQMEAIKTDLESPNLSPAALQKYNRLADALSKCDTVSQVVEPTIKSPFSPAASLCINGAIGGGDPSWQRPATQSTGSGIQAGCPLTVGANKEFDNYSFNLSGCAAFPTEVLITACGPAGCQHLGNTDTTIFLYRNVPAGDPLTANGGLAGVFNPAAPCTNVRAAQDDLGTVAGTTNNPGGSTCNQVIGANCVGPCTSPSNAGALSGMRRQLGSGRFTVVVSGFGDTSAGNYNLYIDAPAAGCVVALAPSAASATIAGRVILLSGSGVSRVDVTLSGGGLAQPMVVRTNGFGYYSFGEVPVGENYVVTVSSKLHTFNPSSRVINLEANITDVDFVSEQ